MNEEIKSHKYVLCGTPNNPEPDKQTPDNKCNAQASKNPIRYSSGSIILPQSDLLIPAGSGLDHIRFFCNKAATWFNSPNGNNWWLNTMPYIYDGGDRKAVVVDPNNPYWFDGTTTFTAWYGLVDVFLTHDNSNHTLTFRQRSGSSQELTVFHDFSVTAAPGQFVSHTDANGIITSVTSRTDDQVNEIQRAYTAGSNTITESLLYAYVSTGSAVGQIESVTYRRKVNAGAWENISRSVYAYYGDTDTHGSHNDLKTSIQQLPDGSGGWNSVQVQYYRYYLGSETTGTPHGLKLHIGPETYRRLINNSIDPLTATDSALMPYADHYFEYDPTSRSVTKEIASGCTSCSGGGTAADLFSYTPNPAEPSSNYNAWKLKTEQTLADGSRNIVYTNFAGLKMLKVQVDPTGTHKWCTYYRYDTNGWLILTAHPSAVTDYSEEFPDLVNFDSTTDSFINPQGLIQITEYYQSTDSNIDSTPGGVEGYVYRQGIRNPQGGSPIWQRSYTYKSRTTASNTVYPIASEVVYPGNTDLPTSITTSYGYEWHTGTNQIQQRTTTLPSVDSDHNGNEATYTLIEKYDLQGNLIERIDERGVVTKYTYDDVLPGAVKQQIDNYQSGVTDPGTNLTTDYVYDSLGRLVQTLGPSHAAVISGSDTTIRSATWTVYKQSVLPTSGPWVEDQVLSAAGYATGSSPSYSFALINPVSITFSTKDGKTTDQITAVRTAGSGALTPSDTFPQSSWQSWSSMQYDAQGHRISSRAYHEIPASGDGIPVTNYAQTDYAYDIMDRQVRVKSPDGTITRTVWEAPGRVVSTWVGTDDTDATPSDPDGSGSPNNMVRITTNVYDNGNDGGNGNLTSVIQHASSNPADDRTTTYVYDFRNRRTVVDGEENTFQKVTYDNLDRATITQRYSPDASSSSNLIGQNQSFYDQRGRVYKSETYAVDASGNLGNALTSQTWYDPSGNVLQQTSAGDGLSAFTKTVTNGAGWVTATYRGYNTSGLSYAQATTVAGDIILSQSVPTYDAAGNVIASASYDRLNDATGTGALSYATSPKARVSYSATWLDGLDRPFASAAYGAIASFTRPATPPASSDTILVSTTDYDSAGRAWQSTDPAGRITQIAFDAANRRTQILESAGTADERETQFTYTLTGQIATLTAVNPDTGDQTTTYVYGTTLADSGVARNDLLRHTIYPDTTSGWSELSLEDQSTLSADQLATLQLDAVHDITTVSYSRLGETSTFTDQRGTVHTFAYDKLGRLLHDRVTTLGSDTDSAVRRLSRTYNPRGQVSTLSSYDNAAPGSGSVLNQVQFTYNAFNQLTSEQQDHAGAVSGSSPAVQYTYADGSSNSVRPTGLLYPTSRTIHYDYGSSGGMNDRISRIGALIDGSTTLASYTSLGGGMVARINYPQPDVRLDLWGGTTGTFAGIDRFGRIIDQRWQNNVSTTPADVDRHQYGYDRSSNRLYKANTVLSTLSEAYSYDALNRLIAFRRGTLNGSKQVPTPTKIQDWDLDLLGNWKSHANADSPLMGDVDLDGTVSPPDLDKVTLGWSTDTLSNRWTDGDLNGDGQVDGADHTLVSDHWSQFGTAGQVQSRTHNKVNQIDSFAGSPAIPAPAYDKAGNMTTFPKPADPTNSFTATYDAWNRLKTLSDTAGLVVTYTYDAASRRIKRVTATETRHFYHTTGWQVIEERLGSATTANRQYLWGLRYIDELICRDRDTNADGTLDERIYALQDANFNVMALANSSGSVIQRFSYTPYGQSAPLTSGGSTTTDAYQWNHRHQGGSLDNDTQLYHFRNREYHQILGRWTKWDRLEFKSSTNIYEYNRSNPRNILDPSGDISIVDTIISHTQSSTELFSKTIPLIPLSPGFIMMNISSEVELSPCCNNNQLCDNLCFIGTIEFYWAFDVSVTVPPKPRVSKPQRRRNRGLLFDGMTGHRPKPSTTIVKPPLIEKIYDSKQRNSYDNTIKSIKGIDGLNSPISPENHISKYHDGKSIPGIPLGVLQNYSPPDYDKCIDGFNWSAYIFIRGALGLLVGYQGSLEYEFANSDQGFLDPSWDNLTSDHGITIGEIEARFQVGGGGEFKYCKISPQ